MFARIVDDSNAVTTYEFDSPINVLFDTSITNDLIDGFSVLSSSKFEDVKETLELGDFQTKIKYLTCLGLIMNADKSYQLPSKQTTIVASTTTSTYINSTTSTPMTALDFRTLARENLIRYAYELKFGDLNGVKMLSTVLSVLTNVTYELSIESSVCITS